MDNQIHEKAADTMLEKAVSVEIRIKHPTLRQRLFKCSSKRVWEIQPISLGSLIKIGKALLEYDFIGEAELSGETGNINFLELAAMNLAKNEDKLINVIALAIWNKESDPPDRMVKFIKENMSAGEAKTIFNVVVQQMGVMDFLACTVLASMTRIAKTEDPQTIGNSSDH